MKNLQTTIHDNQTETRQLPVARHHPLPHFPFRCVGSLNFVPFRRPSCESLSRSRGKRSLMSTPRRAAGSALAAAQAAREERTLTAALGSGGSGHLLALPMELLVHVLSFWPLSSLRCCAPLSVAAHSTRSPTRMTSGGHCLRGATGPTFEQYGCGATGATARLCAPSVIFCSCELLPQPCGLRARP